MMRAVRFFATLLSLATIVHAQSGPILNFSTFFGGGNEVAGELITGIAVDASSNVYVTGWTDSPNFPVTAAAFRTNRVGGVDAFVAKLDATGTNLIYSTYLGGTSNDYAYAIAVDDAGNAYITGETTSTNFPATAGAFQTARRGDTDAFVAKLDPTGSTLLYSTYLGGSDTDFGVGIAVDTAGNAWVDGTTGSTNFPTASAFQATRAGAFDVFVAKLAASGSNLVYSTYLGGGSNEFAGRLALDTDGNAYVTGQTFSRNFPLANAFQRELDRGNTSGAGFDAFVTKLGSTGSNLVYSTYLGGSGRDGGNAIAVNAAGNAYITGATDSTDFPRARAILRELNRGATTTLVTDGFVTQLDPTGTNLVYSTYLGGDQTDAAYSIAVDSAGNALVTGHTLSDNFPHPNALQLGCRGCKEGFADAFVTKISAAGTNFVYSTFLGGNQADFGRAVATDDAGHAYVAGQTQSAQFPRARPFQLTRNGQTDAFITKIEEGEAHDFAVTAIKAPKRVKLPAGGSVTNRVSVRIQNRSRHAETIPDLTTLQNLVQLSAEGLTICMPPAIALHSGKPQKTLPVTVTSKQSLNVIFDVVFDCEDSFRYQASVHHASLPGGVDDTHTDDDACPRSVTPPFEIDPNPNGTIKDKGCGAKKPDRTLGADVVTTVIPQ